jgi:FAD synthetase
LSMKTVMVFGVFDRLHPGHWVFLNQAKKCGKKLIVVVARGSAVVKLKKKKPLMSERARMRVLRSFAGVTKVVLGDQRQSSYTVIKKHKPDIICLGYDQKWLAEDLRKQMRLGKILRIKIVKTKAYKPRKFHTSLL